MQMSKGYLSFVAALFCVPSAGHAQDTATAPTSAPADTIGCPDGPKLTLRQALDWGNVLIPRGEQGYVSVTPDGIVTNAVTVMVQRNPVPGEMELCGTPDEEIAVIVGQPEAAPQLPGGKPVARMINQIELAGSGIVLQRVEQGRWEGRLNASGRATIRVGATLLLEADGEHGAAIADINIDVVKR